MIQDSGRVRSYMKCVHLRVSAHTAYCMKQSHEAISFTFIQFLVTFFSSKATNKQRWKVLSLVLVLIEHKDSCYKYFAIFFYYYFSQFQMHVIDYPYLYLLSKSTVMFMDTTPHQE